MNIVCTQENLNKGLGLVSNIASKNSNLPILNNVLLKAEKGNLTLITTDLELGIKVFVRGKVEEEGEFTVDAKLIHNFVSFLSKENITLKVQDNALEIKSSDQETSMQGIEAEDFPLIPEMDRDSKVEIATKDLKEALHQVVFAASMDASRIEINSVNFNFGSGHLTLAATDSYRLAEKKIAVQNNMQRNLIIPLKTVQELVRILAEQAEDSVKMFFSENQIMFVFDGVELVSRVIDGKYPDYQQIIPEKFETEAKISVKKIVPAIKSVSLFCKQGINDIRLKVNPDKKSVTIETASSGLGKSHAKVPAEIKGTANDIIFNYRFLLDGLNNLDSDEAILKVNNISSPGLVQPEGNKDYLYLVMPIRQ